MIESVSQVNKWNADGRKSVLQDVKYLRSRIESLNIHEFDLLEEYIQMYFTQSRTELLQFIKQKASSELDYDQIKSLLSSCEILSKNDTK